MLSPRKFATGKKFLQRQQNARKRSAQRKIQLEVLEKRELLAADLGIPLSFSLGQDVGALYGSSLGGEGEGANPIVTTEIEPNNLPRTAQPINVGTGATQSRVATVNGQLTVLNNLIMDEDYYAVQLRAGDIFQAAVVSIGAPPSVIVMDANQNELMGTNSPFSAQYVPRNSPLYHATANAVVSLIIPETGTYYVRVGDASGAYSLQMKAMRNSIESEPIGTKQIVYLDFNGAVINGSIYSDSGVLGTTRLPSMIDSLDAYGFIPEEENALIDRIVAVVKENFNGSLPTIGSNGYFREDGRPGAFDIEILNSRDHADPWGLPNVSRVIIGGSIDDFTETIGLAESIDIGNFFREETAVVLAAEFFTGPDADVRLIPRAASKTLVDVYALAMGNVVSHELGHMFGAAHQHAANSTITLMDSGNVPFSRTLIGVGPDGIYGTPDDVDLDFGRDLWSREVDRESTFTGRYDHAIGLSYALSTGMAGGAITGLIYNDTNRNGRQDGGETGLSGWEVFVDLNNNGVRDLGEQFTYSSSTGSYSLIASPGTYTVRVTRPDGWIASTGADAVRTVTVTASGAVANFGSAYPSTSMTGYKWLDLNADGIRDPNEPGIAGVYIYLDLDLDGRPDVGEPAALTKADGSYTLIPPHAGTFTIREVVTPGMRQTFPPSGAHVVQYNGVTPLAGYNFGNSESADWGDAPAPYPTTRANSGAYHGQTDGLMLGVLWDAEQDGHPSLNADGDNLNGVNDEDGIAILTPIVRGDGSNILQVTVTNTTGGAAYVQGWVDFNGDGDWNDAGEKIISDFVVTGSGVFNISFTTPANAVSSTYARFRVSQASGLGPTGGATTGEVEDYQFTIVNGPRTLLQPDTASVTRNSIANPIDVLANDFSIPGEPWTISGVSASQRGGRVTFDPVANIVLYSPPLSFIGVDEFTYTARTATGRTETARVTVNVAAQFLDPVAVDDSFDIPTNSIGYPLNVLANDIEGRGGALVITNVTTPSQGGGVTIGSGGQSIRYTPRRDFGGTETFQYTATDATGKTTTAKITVHVTPGARNDDTVEFSFGFFDLAGNAITEIRQGEQFVLGVYVDDLRPERGQAQVPPVNVVDPGVFAAYLDILYSSGLVSPAAPSQSSPLDFEAMFSAPYTTGFEGTAAIPGVINEFGAYVGSGTMNHPNRVRVGGITFTATNPGLAEFIGDPADISPQTDVVFFNTDRVAVPVSEIRYGRSFIEVVPSGVNFPYAMDDSIGPIPAGQPSTLNVLANDVSGSQPPIRISSVTQPANGQVQIFDNNTPSNFADDRIIYTPNTNFFGTDSFTYRITDAQGFSSTATVTVQVGTTAQVQADDVIELRLSVTDTAGVPVDQVTVGNKFQLRGYVKDLRTSPTAGGIFSAFQDILYSSGLVSVDRTGDAPFFEVTYAAEYSTGTAGDVRINGLINEIGSVQTGNSPLGTAERLQFIITFTANAVGTANFIGDPADIKPFHDTLFYEPTTPLQTRQIRYTSDSVIIVGAGGVPGGSGEGYFTNPSNAYDVNNDGHVSPIDALIVINSLNAGNGGRLNPDGASGEDGYRVYIDVDGDGSLTPLDVLSVVNYINSAPRVTAPAGEGESPEGAPLVVLNGPSSQPVEVPFETHNTVNSAVASLYVGESETADDDSDEPFDFANYMLEDDDREEDEDDLINALLG